MSRVKPLSPLNERRPIHPVDRNYGPPEDGARWHKVRTGEDWHTLATFFWVNEEKLMDYNFKTVTPAEVNWYLREYVGCTTPDKKRDNWKFTNDANPGIIWAPPRVIKSGDVPSLPKPPWRGSWGASLADASGGPHFRVLAIEAVDAVLTGLEMAGAHFGAMLGGVVVAPFAFSAAILSAIGGAHMDAFAIRAKQEAREGYAIGAVLGAKGAKAAFVKNTYMKYHSVDKKLQDVYNISLAVGYFDGQQLNELQVRKLFDILHSRMQGKIPKGDEWNDWSDAQKRSYNNEAAIAFKITFLKP